MEGGPWRGFLHVLPSGGTVREDSWGMGHGEELERPGCVGEHGGLYRTDDHPQGKGE